MATFFLFIIYAAFISLGLPDGLLGVAWPDMQPTYQVPYSYAGFISMVISGGTVVSSLLSTKLIKRLGTGKLTSISVLMTAIALLGFYAAPSYAWLVFLAIPLGLGAGAVDSGLNEYVARHYKSHHMNWLHCFWGIGALTGPALMAQYIAHGQSWRKGYLTVSVIQFVLVVVLFFTLPLWSKAERTSETDSSGSEADEPKSNTLLADFLYPLGVRGVKTALVSFLFYCGIEQTMGLWGSSFFIKAKGLDVATAAIWVSIFFCSITVGRLISGFIAMKVNNKTIIRTSEMIILAGTILLLLPVSNTFSLVGFIFIGLGCAPIYPCMLHETPVRFGREEAQSIMGFQMAVAYSGTTFLPPLFGFIVSNTSIAILPFFILAYGIVLFAASEKLNHLLKMKHRTGVDV